MLKAILYYILLIAEFMITLIIGGTMVGIYMAIGESKGYLKEEAAFYNEISPIIIGISILSMLIVWFTFGHYKFSKFSLGTVIPTAKWKAMLYTSLPMVGITLAYYSMMELFHLDFVPKEMTEMGYFKFIPFALIGSFFSAYVFYGAIQEELIRCGKKPWVQLLTLCLMMLPASAVTVTDDGDISWVYLGIIGLISTGYGFWMYRKTRSTIILFVVCFTSNLVPTKLGSTPLCILLIILGIAITIYGFMALQQKLPGMLQKDED